MTDVLEILKQADPADVRGSAQSRRRATGSRRGGERSRARRAPRRPRRRVRLLVPAGGVAAGLVAVALLLVGGGDGRSVDTAAAAALEKLADSARAQPPTLPPGDPRFLDARTESKGFMAMASEPPFHRGIRTRDDFGFLLDFRATQEVWVGEEAWTPTTEGGRADLCEHPRSRGVGGRRTAQPAAGSRRRDAAGNRHRAARPPRGPGGPPRPASAPRRGVRHGNAYVFTTLITDYLREWGITPTQRAALLDAAARVPGIELLGERRDPTAGPAWASPCQTRRGTRLHIDP